jgi:exopolysaccharide production protein ExoQ
MPPILALILCTIFVLWLLRLEHKQYPDASMALWVPTIWFLLETTKPLAVWFGAGGATMEEGSPLDRTVLTILLGLSLLITLRRKFSWLESLKNNPTVIMLLCMMLVSILWSDMPFVSFKRWFRNLLPVAMAFFVATETDPVKALQSLFRRTIYVHIPFSLLLIKYYPNLGVHYGRWSGALMWVGTSLQKNGLAALCMFAIIFLVWTFIRRRKGRDTAVVWYQTYIDILIFLFAIYLFTGPNHTPTYSATATASLAVGLIALTGLLWLKKRNIIISANLLTILIALVIIYGTVTPFVGGLMFYDPSTVLNRESTLTGRTVIWAYLVPLALNKLALGHGFGGFWTEAIRAKTSSHAHNGYLDTILNTGLLGLFFLSTFLIANCRAARNTMTQDYDWGILWFCYLLISVVKNITESSVYSLTGLLPTVLLFMLIASTSDNTKKYSAEQCVPKIT